MARKPDKLHDAYALKTPEDNRRLYAGWAATYDAEFAEATGYRLPEAVAAAFAALGGAGPVLDVGAGTGLVAERLALRGVGPIDGTDISHAMLGVAEAKGSYRELIEGDATAGLPVPDGAYAGVVSAGTFTLGHLGPAAFPELLRLARPAALFALSINAHHYEEAGFALALAALPVEGLALDDVPIYDGEGVHGADRAFIATFRKA
ncbi:MAG: class I SAM-dependent methyltransferase [Paracoccaceae bacterium]|nr:class I SAM-dependent methyltransferase [Paracoccaceae bacterium]